MKLKRHIALMLTLLLSLSVPAQVFADTKDDKDNDSKPVAEQTEDDGKIDTYIIEHKIYVSVEDLMNLLKYTKVSPTEYTYENKTIVFDGNNKTVTTNGMSKSLPNGILYYMGKTVISTEAVESAFGKVLTTSNVRMSFNVINKQSETPSAYAWTKNRVIAHALGGVNGVTNSNTLDAMKQSYKSNFRLFEVDLLPTVHGELVASHGFYELLASKYGRPIPEQYSNEIPTKEEFLNFKFNGMYKTIDIEEIVAIMSTNPDIYMITDTKITDYAQSAAQFKELVRVCKEIDESVLDRIIPQIYNESMYDAVMSQHKFKSLIYTLYATSATNQQALEFVTAKGIKVVTMPPERINTQDITLFNSYGIKIYTHTINDAEQMKNFKNMGVYGFYTDFITPTQFDSL